jgi:N-acetylglucosamine-6-phosphate deacetylase
MQIIQQVTIYSPGKVIENGAVRIGEGRIEAVGRMDEMPVPEGARVWDGKGLLLAPGFIDLQINGGFGYDFTEDPESIWQVATGLPRYGITAFLATIITSPPEIVSEAQKTVFQPPPQFIGALPLGLHVEGPFLNPVKKGAHNPDYLRLPAQADELDWSPETGVRLVTLAPELAGALELITALSERGVVVSAGHSMATYDQAKAGFEAGIGYGTHLFNAMPPLHHREPGLAGALLDDERVFLGLIADGTHVHPALVRLIWQRARSRLTLVSDAIAAAGMPPGEYRLGSQDIIVTPTESRLADGTLAGCILMLDATLRYLIDCTGCSLAAALPAVTTNPARLLGCTSTKGQIAAGYDADLLLLNPDLEVVATMVGGQIVFGKEELIGTGRNSS